MRRVRAPRLAVLLGAGLLVAPSAWAQSPPTAVEEEDEQPVPEPAPPADGPLYSRGFRVAPDGTVSPAPPQRPAPAMEELHLAPMRLRPPEPPRPPAGTLPMRNAFYVVPVDTIVGAVAVRYGGVTVGYQRRVAPGVELTGQVRFYGCFGSGCYSGGRFTGGVTLGALFRVASPARNQGLFLQPLLRVEAVPTAGARNVASLGVGLGVGYQITAGNFFVAPYIAFSHNVLVDPTGSQRPAYSPGIDFGGIRLGFAVDGVPDVREDAAAHRTAYRHAVWTLPVWSVLATLLNRPNVSLGANISARNHFGVSLLASVEWGQPPNGGIQQTGFSTVNATALRLGGGPQWTVGPTPGLNGFFVGPRAELLLHLTQNTVGRSLPGSLVFLFGGELGYQATLGHLYLAAVTGLNVGFPAYFGSGGPAVAVFNVDLAALRVGYAL